MLDGVKERSPERSEAHRLTQHLRVLLRDRDVEGLPTWLDAAQKCARPELRTVAAGVRRERLGRSAVSSMPGSNGPTEGVANKIERQIYGRRSLDV